VTTEAVDVRTVDSGAADVKLFHFTPFVILLSSFFPDSLKLSTLTPLPVFLKTKHFYDLRGPRGIPSRRNCYISKSIWRVLVCVTCMRCLTEELT
jgi:hypothetical protein